MRSKVAQIRSVVAPFVLLVVLAGCGDSAAEVDALGECVTAAKEQGADETSAELFCEDAVADAGAGEAAAPVPAASEAAATEPAATAAPGGVLPDVVGMDLQTAQDTLQAHGYRHLDSIDDTGRGRHQMVDSHWVVVDMLPSPGSQTPTAYEITMFVVKDDEI